MVQRMYTIRKSMESLSWWHISKSNIGKLMRGFLHRADSAEGNGLAFVEPVPKRWLPFDNRVVFPGLPSGQACPVVGSGTIRETAGAQHTQKGRRPNKAFP